MPSGLAAPNDPKKLPRRQFDSGARQSILYGSIMQLSRSRAAKSCVLGALKQIHGGAMLNSFGSTLAFGPDRV